MATRDLRRRAKTEEAYEGAVPVGRRVIRPGQHLLQAVVQVLGIGVVESVETLVAPREDGASSLFGHRADGDLHGAHSFAESTARGT
jgi:hypothetical protein